MEVTEKEILANAAPQIAKYKGTTVVIKYGGHAMENEDLKAKFAADIVTLKKVACGILNDVMEVLPAPMELLTTLLLLPNVCGWWRCVDGGWWWWRCVDVPSLAGDQCGSGPWGWTPDRGHAQEAQCGEPFRGGKSPQ